MTFPALCSLISQIGLDGIYAGLDGAQGLEGAYEGLEGAYGGVTLVYVS
jgi:hypothetical protein